MTDRQFSECCYGTAFQHPEYHECPAKLHFDEWSQQYHGHYNDVWVRKPTATRKLWTVAFRDHGNITRVQSRHRTEQAALAAGEALVRDRMAKA